MAQPSNNEKEKEIMGALSQPGGEETELEMADEPKQYLEVPKDARKLGRRASERSNLEKVVSAATSIQTNNSELTEATTVPSKAQEPEKQPWLHRINPLKRGKPPPIPEERIVSREYKANFLSLLTFQWINPLMTTGYKRTIEPNDIWLVNPDRSSDRLVTTLMDSFKKRAARNEKSPLIWALYDTLGWDFIIGGICATFSALFQVFSPFTTRFLIQFATEAYNAQHTGSPAPPISRGIGLAIGITLMQICQSVSTNHFIYRGMMCGGESRAVLINAIFEKSLKLSGRAKAGGKALPENQGSNGIDGVVVDEKPKRPGLARLVSSKLHPKTGPKVTADASSGVSGDGTGWNNGKIVNLMSVDTYRVDQASGLFHIIWTSPFQVAIVLVVLCVNLGYSALAGYALLAVCVPLLTKAIKSLFRRRKVINKVTDQRVTLTQEILGAVRFVKFFGWESSFLARLRQLRKKEIRAIQILLSIRNALNALSMSLPVFASMLAFIVYSVTGHDVSSASRIFSSLALFNSLRMPLNLLPMVIGQVTDAQASLGRIQEFLLSEEQSDEIIWNEDMDNAVEINNGSFTWERTATQDSDSPGAKIPNKKEMKMEKKATKSKAKADKKAAKLEENSPSSSTEALSEDTLVTPFKLQDIEFTVGRNELVAVIGTVGSGKTSLLAALAGDMRKTGGKVFMAGSRAFCPQYAWIQNATLKENVMFGKPYKSKWYNQVIDACALRPDLSILPAGDLTEIGERGITLSGGQKQRLNIARAIYFDADIVLMDDPLSAVDAHVGRHIMDEAICGLMKDKCRILATHQLHVLSRCDRIIWMEEGHIQAIDTFDNLMSDSADFRKLMATTSQENELEKKEGVEGGEGGEGGEATKTDKRKKSKKKAAALMQVEERAVKSVSWEVWGAYIKASGPIFLWPLIFFALVLSQGANIATSLWLSYWVSNKFGASRGFYIGIYAMLGALQALLMFTFATLLSTCGTNSSKVMLHRAMESVLRAPMSFFDTTPLGRITNRFSKDVDSMDNSLTDAMRMYFITMGMIVSVFALIIAFFYYFAIALGPLLIIFLFAADYYRSSARELKRHEAVLRSTVFARFSESVAGVASIRAYGLQEYFKERVRDAVDQMDAAYFLTFANQRWLSTRLDMIGNCLVLTVGILVVTNNFNVPPSISGLVLSYILAIVQMIQFTVRQLAEVENNMNATERLHYYGSQLEQEAPLKLKEVSDSWPAAGAITFDDVHMRYRAELPLVLQGLSFQIRGGERVGIVGRTGAGKSSIMSALFRLTELSGGQIQIDGINIAEVGLHDLRSRLAIIPQDPTLFRGTIRSNLDPFNEHTDLELWDALRKADLVSNDASSPIDAKSPMTPTTPTSPTQPTERTQRIHLDSPVEEEGLNYSLGQRQLMALARALVRNAQIIVCDEATSSVDFETDEKIQRTMRSGFAGKTLLCIAHRLKTIINYDRICVMDQGQIAEMDTPLRLFEQGGIFRGMCDKSHIVREDFFRD